MHERDQPENRSAAGRRPRSLRPGGRGGAEPVADAPGWYVVRRPGPEPADDRRRVDQPPFDEPLFDQPPVDEAEADWPDQWETLGARNLGAAAVALGVLALGVALIDAYGLTGPGHELPAAGQIIARDLPPATLPAPEWAAPDHPLPRDVPTRRSARIEPPADARDAAGLRDTRQEAAAALEQLIAERQKVTSDGPGSQAAGPRLTRYPDSFPLLR